MNHLFSTRRLCAARLALALPSLLPLSATATVSTTGAVNPDPTTTTPSTDLDIGVFLQDGSMTIDGGSTVFSDDARLGVNAGTTGTVLIEGTGSRWETRTLDATYEGKGVVDILAGGTLELNTLVFSGSGAADAEKDATITVRGDGSLLKINRAGETVIRFADLSILNQATLQTADTLTFSDPASRSFLIDGAGAALMVGDRLNTTGNTTTLSNGAYASSVGGTIAAADPLWSASMIIEGLDTHWQSTGQISVGATFAGELLVRQGGKVSSTSNLNIGFVNNTSSAVLIQDTGSVIDLTGTVQLGNQSVTTGASSTLDILGGGQLKAIAAELHDPTRIDGVHSLLQLTGHLNASHDLLIFNGAKLTSDTMSTTAQIRITGADACLEVAGQSNVGSQFFLVSDAASYKTGALSHQSGLIRVTGQGTTVEVAGDLNISNGYIQVLSDSALKTGNATLGVNADDFSRVDIRLGNLWSIDGDLQIGEVGTARVNHYSGTVEILTGDLILGRYVPPTPAVGQNLGDGVTESPLQSVTPPAGAGVYALSGGVLDIHGNNILFGDGAAVFEFNGGELFNASVISDTLIQNAGTLSPGDATGITTIDGNYVFYAGTLDIDLSGTAPGSTHDQVVVNGELTLSTSSTLDLELLPGYFPQLGDQFDIIQYTSRTGTFASVQGVALGSNQGLAVTYDDTAGLVNVTAAFLGDANLDGEVSLLDLDVLGQNYGDEGTWAQGDFNGDGEVSLIDLDILGQNYGLGSGPSAGQLSRADMFAYIGQPVPEPSSLALLCLGGLALARRRCG
jgi:T5SS/PEP-CTERM-associated repeat protein